MRKKFSIIGILISFGILTALTGCTEEADSTAQAQTMDEEQIQGINDSVDVQTSYYYLPVGTYDSADTAILESIDQENGTVTLYNTIAAKTYTLNYDGTTYVSDKYGTAMSMAQLAEGTIVNVNFYKATKQLVDIQVSPDAWTYEDVTRYDLGGLNSTASIGDRTYALTKGVQVFSQGEQADLMNIVSGDSITVSGIGSDIYSIKVDTGHGYVRLTNDEALVGGWIEIGNELITRVTEQDMLLAVPEGSYTVRMYNDSSSQTQDITVDRNQEVILDCSEITAPVNMFGKILFHVTPDTATLTLDGLEQDITGIVETEYGIHQIEVSASGYDTLSRYINVGTELSEITVNLDESVAYTSDNSSASTVETTSVSDDSTKTTSSNKSTVSGNTVSSNTTSSNTTTTSTSTSNRVYIYAPSDVEAYVDGIYVGLTPLSFKKVTGSHTVILKKSGYETRSYTIYCYNDSKDMSISFSDLEKTDTSSSSGSSSTSTSSSSTTDSTDSSDDTDIIIVIDDEDDDDEDDDDDDYDDEDYDDDDEDDDDIEDDDDDDISDEDEEIDSLLDELLTPDDKETGRGMLLPLGIHNTRKA